LFISACKSPNGDKRDNVTCYNDSDCPPASASYCDSNNSACLNTTLFRCVASGTQDSACVPNATSVACTPCMSGCVNGSCLLGNATPDLVIRDMTFQVVDNLSDVRLNITVSVMNIGAGLAGQSATNLKVGATVLGQYQTPQLAPQQSVTLQPPATLLLLRGTTSTLTATADTQNQVVESREDNNRLTRAIS